MWDQQGPADARPRTVVDTVRSVRRQARTVRQVDDLRGRAQVLRMIAESALGRGAAEATAGTAVAVSARRISDRPVWLRPRSRDHTALACLEGQQHLPPPELVEPPRTVAVLGAGIGLLLADLAVTYPGCRLLGVEPDEDARILAGRNLAHLGERCRLEPSALDVAALLDEFSGGAGVDYVLVTDGPAWSRMVSLGEWSPGVRCLKVQVRDHFDEAVSLLRDHGYRARIELLTWGAYAVGIRP